MSIQEYNSMVPFQVSTQSNENHDQTLFRSDVKGPEFRKTAHETAQVVAEHYRKMQDHIYPLCAEKLGPSGPRWKAQNPFHRPLPLYWTIFSSYGGCGFDSLIFLLSHSALAMPFVGRTKLSLPRSPSKLKIVQYRGALLIFDILLQRPSVHA